MLYTSVCITERYSYLLTWSVLPVASGHQDSVLWVFVAVCFVVVVCIMLLSYGVECNIVCVIFMFILFICIFT
jgi:hypothetical protein